MSCSWGTLKTSFNKYVVDRPIIDTFPNQLVVLNLHFKKIRHATFKKISAVLRTLTMTSTSTNFLLPMGEFTKIPRNLVPELGVHAI